MIADIFSCVHGFKGELQEVDKRVRQIEDKMGEYASLVDAHETHRNEVHWLNAKEADLGDRSRWNDLKVVV